MTEPSPFIPETQYQIAWDSTSLGWLKECPRKYYYHMIEGWTSKHEAVDLKFGQLYHGALEIYDRYLAKGIDHDLSVKAAVEHALTHSWTDGVGPWRSAINLDPNDRKSLKCREFLIRSVVWYLDRFKNDPAKTKIMVGGLPMVELNFKFEIDYEFSYGTPYSLCGYLDRVVEFQGEPFVMDRKTTLMTLGSSYFDNYDPDNQMSLYSVAARIAFHTPVRGVIIDAMQIAVGFSRSVRHFIFKTPDQLDEWMKDLRMWLENARMYAIAKHWPMNDKSCHKFGGCVFRHVCSKSPSVRDRFLESDFVRREWNPLIPRN